MTYTPINIPYSAVMGVMTSVSGECALLWSYRFDRACSGQLLITSNARPVVALIAGGKRSCWIHGCEAVFAVAAIRLFLSTFSVKRERVSLPVGQKSNLKRELRLLVTNQPWLVLFAATIFALANFVIRGTIALQYFEYYADDDGAPFIDRRACMFAAASRYVTQIWSRRCCFQALADCLLVVSMPCSSIWSKHMRSMSVASS